jgi:ketopantoate reductase
MLKLSSRIKLVIDGKIHEVDGVNMELVPRLKDQPIVQETQSPSPSLLTPRGISITTKSSQSAGISLNYLLRAKNPRCSLGRPQQRVEHNAHPIHPRHPAFSDGPSRILNLISTLRSKYSVSGMQGFAYRLRRETTVVATQAAMGLVEEVYRTVFRDPRSRPTFLIGVTTQSVWEPSLNASNSSASMDHKNTLQKLLKGERVIQASFTAAFAGFGSFSLGPLALAPNTESPRSERKRELTAQYLINTLIACTPLNAGRVNQGTSLYRRLKTAVSYSAVGPLSALQECNISEIFDDDKWRQIGLDLIKEAWLVIRHDPRMSFPFR